MQPTLTKALLAILGGSSTLNIQAVPGGDTASPSQTGILLMYRDGSTEREANAIAVVP